MPTLEAVRELERLSAWTQYQKGLTPQWARPMTPAEVKSRCNFAALDRIMRKAYTDAAAVLDTFRQAIIQDLRRTVGHITDPKDLSKVLATWSMDASPGVREARALAVGAMHSVLLDAAQQSGRQLMQEARAQGVTVDPSLPVVVKAAAGDPFSEDSADALLGEAQSPVAAVENRLASAAISESQRPGSADDPVKKVEDAKIGPAVDLASQGIHIASGEGRSAAADVLPDAESWYASELLDGNTCDPCAAVDGTDYASLAEAEDDYPASGPYKDCDGDARCRGTLVAVWGEQPSGEGDTSGDVPSEDQPEDVTPEDLPSPDISPPHPRSSGSSRCRSPEAPTSDDSEELSAGIVTTFAEDGLCEVPSILPYEGKPASKMGANAYSNIHADVWGQIRQERTPRINALDSYIYKGNEDMNNFLRSGTVNSDVMAAKKTDREITWADGLIHDYGYTLPANKIAYRGMASQFLPDGALIRDDGFLSVSMTKKVAARFGEVIEIEMPKGLKVLPASNSEQEFILPRGTALQQVGPNRFRVVTSETVQSRPMPGVNYPDRSGSG